jgi:tetratricopeptide (TPR) repeat protein
MPQSAFKALRWRGFIVCVCLVTAALGGYAFIHRSDAGPVTRERPAAEWLTDVRRAIGVAHAQGKDVLIEFSAPAGSTSAAHALDASLLDTDAFLRAVGGTFVLVRLAPSEETSAGNLTEVTTWAQRLSIARFPTFVLLDTEAKAYARSELVAKDAASYQKEFERLREIKTQRDKALALAAAAKGIEKAKLLDKALATVASFADSDYLDFEHQIVTLDPENAAGLKAKYESTVVTRQLDAVIQNEIYPLADRGKYRDAIARLEKLIVQLHPPRPQLQLLTAFKGQLYFSLGDKKQAVRFLDEAIALDPQSESAARARAAKLQLAGLQ